MNSIIKASVRACMRTLVSPANKITVTSSKALIRTPAYARTFWHMCSSDSMKQTNGVKPASLTELCTCGCKCVHTSGEKELVDFLKEEIVAEKKAQKRKTLPTEVDGFKVKTDGSEITLTKEGPEETITVSFNVNHTVDADHEPEINQNAEQADVGEMRSKPTFDVDITKKGKTLSFSCSFTEGGEQPSDEGYNDIFGIDEVTFFEGTWSEKTYAVDGEVLDGYLYDILMTILEEKGISNEFVQRLSDYATSYEHYSYIGLLENINNFVLGK